MELELTRDMSWRLSWFVLAAALVLSLALKVPHLGLGSPYVTIDDDTAYKGGFLVWFGAAPPQRMYLESWVNGMSSLAVYVGRKAAAGDVRGLGLNLVADAYRDFYNHPETYVKVYRGLMLSVDLATAALLLALGRALLPGRRVRWVSIVAAAMYLLSYNTIWCGIVARPDTLTAFFGTLGLLGYYRSDFGRRRPPFYLAAVAFGLCAGMKLHGAFFVVFILLDMVREHGLHRGLATAVPFVLVAVSAFAVAAGTPLFDPLKYVKLRMLNVADDKSPWIQWGDQVVTALRGAGWLVLPLVVWSAVAAWRERADVEQNRLRSLALLASCWLLLFLGLRQLRAYWMLPALPLLYLAALASLASLRRGRLAAAVVAALLLVLGWQSVEQARKLRRVGYGELREWVRTNVRAEEPFFIFGYSALDLPKNTQCMSKTRQGLERGLAADLAAGVPYVERHLKNWEEQSALSLMDLLGFRNEPGWEFYSYFGTPLDRFRGIVDIDDMRYLLVQEGFNSPPDFPLGDYLAEDFDLVATDVTGNGGGDFGLAYRIYRRKGGDAN